MPEAGALNAQGRGIAKALRRLGDLTNRPVRIDSKEDRIRFQKLVYLLKVGGYAPARKFNFNLYQNGPYSPDLTQVYFQLGNHGIASAAPANDVPPGLLRTIVEADQRGVGFLEALATTLDTVSSLRREGAAGSELGRGLAWAKSIKPQFQESVWQEVRQFLRNHPDLAGSTSTRGT